jgi:hypothetical protein
VRRCASVCAMMMSLAVMCGPIRGIAQSGLPAVGAAPISAATPVIELRDGQWFDGLRFVAGSRWVRGGVFIPRPSRAADSVVSLAGQWMVPPYGDAHTHSPDGMPTYDMVRSAYLTNGVFYVQTLANTVTGRRGMSGVLGMPHQPDVAFADAAITATGGHPHILYERIAQNRWGMWKSDDELREAFNGRASDNNAYIRYDSLPQLDSIVARLARNPAPVLKVMLLESERHAALVRDSARSGQYGLNPALLPPLVRAAHALGRRVWAHVETPTDMRIALDAGVDAFAHVPGYGAADRPDSTLASLIIPPSVVAEAGQRRVLMTVTAAIGLGSAGVDTARQRRFTTVVRRNIRALHQAGVRVLVGSDTYSDSRIIRTEPRAVAELLGLSPVQRLRLWAVDTPQAIFPNRRIGVLAPTYEASVLALRCNPLGNADCLTDIARRLKQGVWIAP